MVYNYKTDYEHIFDAPTKKEQERVIVVKIMDLLNKEKYDSIYDFIAQNATYQEFLKNNNLETVIKHFGNTLNELDFKNILNQIIKITEKKRSFDKENVSTQNVDGSEYVVYEGTNKDYMLDNSHSKMSIERQMEELQKTQNKFQTTNQRKNTDLMMEELEKEKKESLNLQYLHEVDISKLNNNERNLFNLAANLQLHSHEPLRIDLERNLIVSKSNNIMKIENRDGNLTIVNENSERKDISNKQEVVEPKGNQKKLIPSSNTIYSANN